MRKRRSRFLWVTAALLLAVLAAGASIWRANRPRMKEYILPGSGNDRLTHTGVKFAYPADLKVSRGDAPYEVRVEHVPLTGIALWIEQRTHFRQVTDWDDTCFTVGYNPDE